MTYQNLWNTIKTSLTEVYTMNSYVRKSEQAQIHNLVMHLKFLEKRAIQTKSKNKEENFKYQSRN